MLICFIPMLFIFSLNSFCQLSPGKLSKSHSKLEGITNCTQCHLIGDKVSNQKCLTCHKDLNLQITKNKGFHSSPQNKNKECIECHSEHHGLNFEMVRFDKKTFNHNLTGYELKGAHKAKITNCNECHKPENISNLSLKKKTNTYLGLDTKCSSCHEDYHQKTLSNDCASCHDFNSFKPATLFNHDKTSFVLEGAHKNVECASCHKPETINGKKIINYAGLKLTNCSSCHKDVHKGAFGINCSSCHNEESFKKIVQSKGFNHSVTGYILEGKHRVISCQKCHENAAGNTGSFNEFKQKKNVTCIDCHKDIHEGKLGIDCKSCHNQQSFLLKGKSFVGKFDHDKTSYPLKGKHQTVDCRVCHKNDLTEPLAHNLCISCHKDKHNGDFDSKKSKYPDCSSCHNDDGFSPSLFTIEDHKNSKFKLEGAHLAQPCFACHLLEKKWVFNNMKMECVDCHKDIHAGVIDRKYYSNQSCSACHSTNNWKEIKFNHISTGYSLVGKHSRIACSECHFDKKKEPFTQLFKGVSKECVTCHSDVHGKQFERNSITDCSSCHGFETWDSKVFNHENTKYKLDGKHKNVDCVKCHKYTLPGESKIRLFKIERYECVDCHL